MGEFSSGRSRVITRATSPETTETVVPEYSSPQVGIITHTRYIRGPAGVDGEDGEDGTSSTPESATLAYDGDGLLVSVTRVSGVTSLAYDGDDRLVTVTAPDHTKTLAYNGDGQLTTVTVS